MAEPASRTVQVLGCRVSLTGEADLLAAVSASWPQLLGGDGVVPSVDVDMALAPGCTEAEALAEITAEVVRASPLHCLHAGVVGGADGLIAVPGASGLGKTTAIAALTMAGFDYLSDEALALDRTSGRAFAFPRPLQVSGASCRVLGIAAPTVADTDEIMIAPAELGQVGTSGRVRDVLLLRRRPGVVHVAPGGRAAAVAELLRRSFNHYRDPRSSTRSVIELVRAARVWEIEYADARELAATVADAVQRPVRTIAM
jgi:hypothetical protein